MSHLTASTIRITDIDILKKAVKGFGGLKWNEGATRFKSYSESHSDGCKHSISVKGASYEIGVIQKDDGYVLAYDEADYNVRELVGSKSFKLMAAYGEAFARDFAEKRGFMVETGYDEEGNLQLTMIDPS